jgi:hypothetical protein
VSGFVPNDMPKKLNLGCGEFTLPGYINVDIQPPADVIGDFLQMEFSAVTDVVMSHILEHISWQETAAVLKKVHSWMVPGGTILVEVPDMDAVMARGTYDQFAEIAIYGIQSAIGEFHLAGFNLGKLTSFLTTAGFTVTSNRAFISDHPARPGFPCIEAIGEA